MTLTNWKMRSTALAAVLSLPFATGAALAQEATATDQASPATQSEQTSSPDQQTAQMDAQTNAQSAGQDASGNPQPDALVATVGEAEIRGDDVMTVVGMLPPQLQAQSPQMLVPIALEQLIMRELVLEKARSENLAQDPEVTELVRRTTEDAEKNAMVQVWLDREMAKAVSDEAVQQSYDEAQAQGQQDLPPLEVVRPQIEQHLRQQAMQEIRVMLREGADVVLYDPTGRPIEEPATSGDTGGASAEGGSEAGQMSGNADTTRSGSSSTATPQETEGEAADGAASSADSGADAPAEAEQPSGN